MSVYERFTGFAQNVEKALFSAAVVVYAPAIEVPGTPVEAEMANASVALLVTAIGVRVLECCA